MQESIHREQPVVEIMDVTKVCSTFPVRFGVQIPRDNIHQSIETILESDVDLVTIEGPEGIGKSTLLAQFAERQLNRCICMFVKPTSRLAYDPALLRADLCNQINWILSGKEIASERAGKQSFYLKSLMELQRRARRPRERFYFVVDGLEDLPSDDECLQNILDLLPFGLPHFRFLISGSSSEILRLTKHRLTSKSVMVTGFTLGETTKFFADVSVSDELINEFFKACKCVPSRLAAFKRIIQSGVSPASLSEQLPDTLMDAFKLEWKVVGDENDLQRSVLAVLAYDNRRLSTEAVAAILGASSTEVDGALRPLTFIEQPPTQGGEVRFVSEAFKRFAQLQLSGQKDQVRSRTITALLRDPVSGDSLTYLPGYLKESGRLPDLLAFLSPEHLVAMVRSSEDLVLVRQKASLGVRAAIDLDKDDDLYRFGLQEAIIGELDGCEVSRSEVRARMALDDYDSALALAQATVLKQDRLRLLALIARLQKENGLTPEAALLEQVSQLYQESDPSTLGDNLVEFASDLMHSRVDLAIQLVERARPSVDGDRRRDWALVQLSIEAAGQLNRANHFRSAAEDINAKIKDPAALRFSKTIALLVGKYTPSEVLREAQKLQSRADQLFLLQEWAANTREPEKAGDVIEYALKLTIRSTEHTPHATNLCKLAAPLPFLTNLEQLTELIVTFDTQKSTIEKLGPTEDYLRLQLLLTKAEAKLDRHRATERLMGAYTYASDRTDLETKTACLARLVGSIPEIDPTGDLPDTRHIAEVAEKELRVSVSALLEATALHDVVSKNIIEALSKNRADLAFEVAASLNVEHRRDSARLDLFDHILQQRAVRIPFPLLLGFLNAIVDPDIRGEAIRMVLDRVARMKPEGIARFAHETIPFIERAAAIEDLGERYKANCSALIILSQTDSRTQLAKQVEKDLYETWNRMELGREKVEAGFLIASSLAPTHRSLAESYLKAADGLRRNSSLEYDLHSLVACIRLGMRAYAGLLPKKFEHGTDLERLTSQIELVHSDISRITLWNELALRCFQHDRVANGRRLVGERIKTNIDAIAKRSESEWKLSVVISAPALYLNHKASTMDLLSKLDADNRDKAITRIITYIFRKIPLSEPYEIRSEGPFPALSYEDALDICELLQQTVEDAAIYATIRGAVESIIWKRNQKPLTAQQKAEIAQKVTAIIDKNLPAPGYIAHNGFQIACRAEIVKLTKPRPLPWEQLVSAAKLIPNLSDRVFVLARIAGTVVDADISQRVALLKEVKTMAEGIPSILDRADRFELLAEEARDIDLTLCKQLIRAAISSTQAVDDDEAKSVRRRMVDLAHRIDPELAGTLASSFDDDRARAEARERIELEDMRRKISEGRNDPMPSGIEAEAISLEFWKLLGQLNAGRTQPIPVTDTRRYVELASNLPLRVAYPILAWVLENAIQRRAGAEESRKLLRGFFDASLVGCELSHMLTGRAADKFRDFVRDSSVRSNQSSVLIHSGQRDVALEFIRNWIGTKASGYLKICDPYFGPDDLEALQLLLSSSQDIEVSILTSKKHQDGHIVAGVPIENVYAQQWRKISDQAPPNTEVVIVGDASGSLPIHERWWLTRGAGLKIGTSFNSLGGKRESEISCMSDAEAELREREVDEYLTFKKREHEGRRLNVHTFMISHYG